MKLFAKKTKSPDPPPPVAPPELPVTEVPPANSALKLDLPDVFAFEEHATKAKTNPRPTRADGAGSRTRGAVLLVESDEEVCRLISRLLQHEGYEVRKASCLAEARTAMKDAPVDFLIARRQSVPLNLQTEHTLRELATKTDVHIVDDFSELMLGQVVDYESMTQCTTALCDLLMSLLEGANAGARGHAHSVAKYCRLVGQRLGLSRRELDALTIAAYLHDLGALGAPHPIGAALLENDSRSATSASATLDMLANVAFPYPINELLSPSANSRSAHILRVADLFDTLRRRDGTVDEDLLFKQMRQWPAGTIDPEVLETFIYMRQQERAISEMCLFRATILQVDPHPEESQVLRLRLANDNFHVVVAKSLAEAIPVVRSEKITLVLTEHHLAGNGDGFELLRTLKTDPSLTGIPVVFHAPATTDLIKQALEQGAEDWFGKPDNIEIIAIKLQRIVRRLLVDPAASNDGVQGNLSSLGIIELIQVLSGDGRSVKILLTKGQTPAELVLHKGQIITAATGHLEGEAAALEILGWKDGQFRILPLKQVPTASIRNSTDSLLLQSCAHQDKESKTHD